MRKELYERKTQPTIRFYVRPEIKKKLDDYKKETGVSLQFIFEKYAEEFVKNKNKGVGVGE